MTDEPKSEDHEVGYGKPPREHQFKKGDGRARPGRPKRSLNLKTDLLAELGEIVPLRLNGTQRNISKQRAVLKVLMTKAIQGDMRATQALLSLMNRVLGPPTEEEVKTEPSAEDVAIVADLIAKMSKSGGQP
jgi:hypothetical protein